MVKGEGKKGAGGGWWRGERGGGRWGREVGKGGG